MRRVFPQNDHGAAASRPRFLFVGATILGILLLQLAAVVFAGVSARRDSDAATRDLFGFVGDATIERVLRFIEPATTLTDEVVASIESGELVGDPETVAVLLFERFQFHGDVYGTYIGYPDGSYVFTRRVEGGFEVEVISTDPVRKVTISRYDEAFHLVSSASDETDMFDPRARPWYTLALSKDDLAWTDPFVFFRSGKPGVSATLAAHDAAGNLIAVAGTQVNLEDISTLLGQLPLGRDGEAFVLAADRTVIAAPPEYSATISAESGGTFLTVPASALGLPSAPPEEVSEPNSVAFGRDGSYVTLERSFPTDSGIQWTLFLRATQQDLSTSVGGFERTMLWLSLLIAALVAAATFVLYRVRLPIGELHHRAGTDELTGLANRRRLFEQGGALVLSAHESGTGACVAVFDLDEFKRVNDEFGHDKGDDVLREVAASLVAASRGRDFVARLGGDEFVTIIRVGSSVAAERAVERTRADLEEVLRAAFPGVRGLGVTVGFSMSDGGHQDLGTLIHEADVALIRGKKHGKGRTYPSARVVAARG